MPTDGLWIFLFPLTSGFRFGRAWRTEGSDMKITPTFRLFALFALLETTVASPAKAVIERRREVFGFDAFALNGCEPIWTQR